MKIIAMIDFSLKGRIYKKGQEVKITSKEELIKLNERGYIEPLSFNEIQNFDKEKNKKKEGIKNEL